MQCYKEVYDFLTALHHIRSVRRSLSHQAMMTLNRAMVISKIDYCNSILAGVSRHLLDRLQSVLHAARLVFLARQSDHINSLLRELHWLRVPEHIQFRLCVMEYPCLNGMAPSYLANGLCRATDDDASHR